ncbi:MAG: TetR/AcrR family transcriptional regulator [Candidatus Binatia bacterium]
MATYPSRNPGAVNGSVTRLTKKDILQKFRRQALLDATRQVIAVSGFDSVTMERVAELAGITKGAIYLYFRNKDEMILETLEKTTAEMLQEIQDSVDQGAAPWDRLCQIVTAQLATLEHHKDMLRTSLLFRWLLENPRERKKWRRLLRNRGIQQGRIKSILEDGIAQKIFLQMDTDTAAFCVNEMAIGAAHRRMMGFSEASLEDDTARLIGFLSLLCVDDKHETAS